MTTFKGEHDKSHAKKLTGKARVFWSKQRAWPGEELTISLRTEHVKDGTAAELKILVKDGATELDKVTGVSVDKGKLDHAYTIDWKTKNPPADKLEYVVEAVVDGKITSPHSPVLIVDCSPPLFSA